ncbi:MAG: acyltransferase family protein [Bacteroidales bacterium]|nr:acyltransferase family protein [Bacteroidales bacterium]
MATTTNNVSSITKERIEYIDLAKGLCISLVLLRHVATMFKVSYPFAEEMTIFRMPLYFVLSGLFFKEYSGFSNFFKRKINKLLIPFFAFYILFSIIFPNLMSVIAPDFIPLNHLGMRSLTGIYYEKSYNIPIWFLLCLFFDNVLFYLVLLLSKKITKHYIYPLAIFSLAIGVGGFVLGYNVINIPFYLDTTMTCLPFFCLGYILMNYTKILVKNSFDKYLPFVVPLCFLFVYFFAKPLEYESNDLDSATMFSMYSCGVIGTLGILFLAKMLKRLPLFSYIGQYSIMILCTHYILMKFPYALLVRLHILPSLSMIITLAVLLLSYYAFIPLMKRFMPHITAQKNLIRV